MLANFLERRFHVNAYHITWFFRSFTLSRTAALCPRAWGGLTIGPFIIWPRFGSVARFNPCQRISAAYFLVGSADVRISLRAT